MQQKKGVRTRVLLVAAMALGIVSVTLASLWLVLNIIRGCAAAHNIVNRCLADYRSRCSIYMGPTADPISSLTLLEERI